MNKKFLSEAIAHQHHVGIEFEKVFHKFYDSRVSMGANSVLSLIIIEVFVKLRESIYWSTYMSVSVANIIDKKMNK